MKLEQRLKVILIILLIILVSVISFAGIYVQDKNGMKNILKDYKLGMDLKGHRVVSIAVDDSKNTVYYDKNGKVVNSEVKGGKKEEVPVNSKDILNKEGYEKTKQIIEKRLNEFKVEEYLIRLDENTGRMTVQLAEDNKTDLAAQYLYTVGAFTIEDENGKVLLDGSNIKRARIGQNQIETGAIATYINLEFNEDSVETLRNISTTYVESTDEKGNDNSKKISIKLDGNVLLETSFAEEIKTGTLSLSLGTAGTTTEEIAQSYEQAKNIAILLNTGKLPITYTVEQNKYIQSDITGQDILLGVAIISVAVVIGIVFLIIKYRKNGLLTSIAIIGYIAILLLALRNFNVVITTEGIFGIAISIILNYVFSLYMLKTINKNKEIPVKNAYNKGFIAMLLILVPAIIVGITLCFATWIPMYSFGAVIFWGILIMVVYNILVTRTLLLCKEDK